MTEKVYLHEVLDLIYRYKDIMKRKADKYLNGDECDVSFIKSAKCMQYVYCLNNVAKMLKDNFGEYHD